MVYVLDKRGSSIGGEWVPLFIALIFLLIVGVGIPLIVNGMTDVSQPSPTNSIITPFVNFVSEGVALGNISLFGITIIPEISLNPFYFLGTTLQDNLTTYIESFAYIDNNILIPVIILSFLAFAYTLIKLVRG